MITVWTVGIKNVTEYIVIDADAVCARELIVFVWDDLNMLLREIKSYRGIMFIKYWDFANPSRIARVQNAGEVIKLVNQWNGLTNLYLSVNPYESISIDEFGNEIRHAFISRAFFDFDHDTESVRKFTKYLLAEDIRFDLYHSGSGHHVYVHLIGEGNGQNLRILQLSLLNACKATCDMHVVGDTQRVSRIPNTWNFKSNSYCIPIQVEEIGKEEQYNKAQRFEKFPYGNKKLNLSSYTEKEFEYIKPEIISDMKINTDILLIPCISNIVKKINPTQIERYVLVIFLSNAIRNGRDLRNFDKQIIGEQVMDFFSENCTHWMDWNPRVTSYQIHNIIPKSNVICGCKFLRGRGLCINCIPGGL